MKRASYRHAVAWIAENDSAGEPENVEDMISTLLVADIFGVEPSRVARDVTRYRKKEMS